MQDKKNESFLDYAKRIVTDDNISEYGIVKVYQMLFDDEMISYDNAQRQLRGIRRFLLECERDNYKETNEIKSTQIDLSINNDGTQTRNALLELSEEEIKTPELLLKAHGYDIEQFELVNSKNSMWHQNSNKSGLKTLYCSKITVRPRSEISMETVQRVFDKLSREVSNRDFDIFKNKQKNDDDYSDEAFVLNFFDVHFAKLAHNSETGDGYNYQIAKQRMIESVKKYEEYYMKQEKFFDEIYFAIGNDFFNSEPTGDTVRGTKQHNDCNYSVMFEEGCKALIEVIDILRTMGDRIIIPLVQGNHSTYTEYYAAQFLKAWYRNCDDVKVDSEATPRKYYKFGTNLFGFTHNSEEKNRIYTLMQNEAPQLWANTIERTWFTGHLHNEDVKQVDGIFIRQAPTMCGTDSWHKTKGYFNPIKRTQGFVYDFNDGLTDIHYVKVD